ncbi:hypothetical protein EI94DRAFT_1700988 [Lactarius quietus]|nr:hypothetical protein EI94DRAFT_1700988 [Lactarius quietus]
MRFSFFAAGLLLFPSVNAFWILPCAIPVLDARVDPIVSPGKPNSHAHTMMGSNAIGYNTQFQDLRNSHCTTCGVSADKSVYWVPEMYYQYKNGSFQRVDHGGMEVYYLQRNGPNETVVAFPDGLRMLTGDPYSRSNSGTPESQAISWLCIDFNGPAQQQTPGFTNTNCPDGLRGQIFFPGCWDGVNLDSANHKSHMAYPSGIDSGECPYTHPVHVVSIFYEVWYGVGPFNSLNDGGRFVLANGDSTGHGFHGDFLNGWDNNVLSNAVQKCTDGTGNIQNCPVFADAGLLQTNQQMNSCSATNPLPSEDITGPMASLPGCVAVTNGPAEASPTDLDPGCTAASRRRSPDADLMPNVHKRRRHRAMRGRDWQLSI